MTKTTKNTLKSVLVLFAIAAVSVLLLAFANYFIKVEIKVDQKTATLINSIAPTGVTDELAFKDKHIVLVKLENASYKLKSIDDFNKTYGNTGTKIRALYTSYNVKTKVTTLVVESSGTGYENGEIVMLTAYDSANKISGIVAKAQTQSYWDKLGDHIDGGIPAFYKAFIGMSGSITSNDLAGATGATIKGTLGGISNAVSLANQFVVSLGGEQKLPPAVVTDTALIASLKNVSDATTFTKYFETLPQKISAVYVGDNGDVIYEAIADEGKSASEAGTYGKVTMLITANSDKKVTKVWLLKNSFDPNDDHDSSMLLDNTVLNGIFAGKNIADINNMSNDLAGSSGATESNRGLKQAVINALEFIDTFAEVERI